MARIILIALLLLGISGAAFAQVRITGASGNLGSLVGSSSLVTVVLKGGIKDSNLRVSAVNGATITFTTDKGEQAIYTTSGIEEIQVQGGEVAKSDIVFLKDVLAPADKQVVERAYARAKEIFGAATKEQNIKIQAAALLALNNDEEAKTYLNQLASAGDLQTAMDACGAMYLAGVPLPDGLLRQGLESSSRVVKGVAAELSGLTKFTDAEPLLVRLAQDRTWEISSPACRAVARLGNREIIPTLLSGINERSDDKSAAVMWSLLRLGGPDIIEQLKLRLEQAQSIERYRIVYLLFRLGDPEGKRSLIEVMADMPTLQLQAALALGSEGDVTAMDMLRQRLRRREDVTEENLINRANTAAALIRGGDPAPKGVLQELMRDKKAPVRKVTFELISRLNNRTMLALMQSSIENVESSVAIEAATAAISLGVSDFRARLLDLRAAEEAALGDRKR